MDVPLRGIWTELPGLRSCRSSSVFQLKGRRVPQGLNVMCGWAAKSGNAPDAGHAGVRLCGKPSRQCGCALLHGARREQPDRRARRTDAGCWMLDDGSRTELVVCRMMPSSVASVPSLRPWIMLDRSFWWQPPLSPANHAWG